MEETSLNFHTVRCCICNSVLLNLPAEELEKFNSLTLRCESCGHQLVLNGTTISKVLCVESLHNVFKYDFNI